MAGGRGTRFWPRSREKKPKHLLDIVSKRTIIQETVDRIKSLIEPANILVVTGKKHARELIKQLPEIPAQNIIIEPVGKNTAACIGLAALHIQKKVPDAVMVVLPSDHAIGDYRKYLEVISAAAKVAEQEGGLVTIGIKPSGPQTGFGYIEQGQSLRNVSGKKVFRVKSIREKPDLQKARKFVQSGKFYWNSGMFIWKASTLLENFQRFQPEMAIQLRQIADAGGVRSRAFRRLYPRLQKISIDYALMEKVSNIYAVPADIGWNDVGSWAVVYELSPQDPEKNVRPRASLSLDSHGNMVFSPKKLVVTVGVQDLIVVETDDALLVCARDRSQDVGRAVQELDRLGRRDLL